MSSEITGTHSEEMARTKLLSIWSAHPTSSCPFPSSFMHQVWCRPRLSHYSLASDVGSPQYRNTNHLIPPSHDHAQYLIECGIRVFGTVFSFPRPSSSSYIHAYIHHMIHHSSPRQVKSRQDHYETSGKNTLSASLFSLVIKTPILSNNPRTYSSSNPYMLLPLDPRHYLTPSKCNHWKGMR